MSPTNWFRQHRHDVLNELQLVRAYLQMGHEERALSVIDRAAEWIQSLTKWQQVFTDIGAGMVFVASTCPNVLLTEVHAASCPSGEIVDELSAWLSAVQQNLAVIGKRISIRLEIVEGSCTVAISGLALNGDWTSEWEQWKAFRTLVFMLDER